MRRERRTSTSLRSTHGLAARFHSLPRPPACPWQKSLRRLWRGPRSRPSSNRFPGVEPLLGPEMKSTGEVMGHDADLARAIAKAQVGAGVALPTGGTGVLSVRDEDKAALAPIARDLADMGFALLATGGTARFLREAGLEAARVNKVAEGQPHIVDAMINGDIALAINTTTKTAAAAADAHSMRRVALMHKIPYYTLLTAARAGVQAIGALRVGGMTATPLQKRQRVR